THRAILAVEGMENRIVPSTVLDALVANFHGSAFPLHSGASVGPPTTVQCPGQVAIHQNGMGNLDPNTTFAFSFDVVGNVGADGTCTYVETYTFSLDSVITPPQPGGLATHDWGTYHYEFDASSSATDSHFTLIASLSIHQTGSQTENTNGADGS